MKEVGNSSGCDNSLCGGGRSTMMAASIQDFRYGLRMLRKSPAFTFVAVVTLALGIGANTAIFSVADAFLVRPVSVSDPNRLVMVMELPPGHAAVENWNLVAPGNFEDW